MPRPPASPFNRPPFPHGKNHIRRRWMTRVLTAGASTDPVEVFRAEIAAALASTCLEERERRALKTALKMCVRDGHVLMSEAGFRAFNRIRHNIKTKERLASYGETEEPEE
jgi:hypothetical protein